MPGAWEIGRQEVLAAILTRETVTTAWAKSHREMRLPIGSRIGYFAGMPFDNARNVACETMLREGFGYLFFVDDDVQVPPDAYEILKSNNLDIVSGLYYRRNEPIAPVAVVDLPGKTGTTWLQSWKGRQIVDVKYVGAGCLLIRRNVLEVMPPPWFDWMVDRGDVPGPRRISEDFEFCRKAKENHGFRICVDTRVQCSHFGIFEAKTNGAISPVLVQ